MEDPFALAPIEVVGGRDWAHSVDEQNLERPVMELGALLDRKHWLWPHQRDDS